MSCFKRELLKMNTIRNLYEFHKETLVLIGSGFLNNWDLFLQFSNDKYMIFCPHGSCAFHGARYLFLGSML
jgi:hypothetical protein